MPLFRDGIVGTAVTLHLDAQSVEPHISWLGAIRSIVNGHTLASPQVGDNLLRRGDDAVLTRSALIDGLGSLVKTATVFPGNARLQRPTINGSVSLFGDLTGDLQATIDFTLLTKWKTAADSALAAGRLARIDSDRILIIGSGTVAASMVESYRTVFPNASIAIWSRNIEHARRLAVATGCDVVDELISFVTSADVICTATLSSTPVLEGRWLRPGQHLDLIGGYRPDMREIDDEAISRCRVFADNLSTALDVGDICDPIRAGVIDRNDIIDFSGLASKTFVRKSPDDITVCKNAGGAHLDLMVARYMFDAIA